MFSICGVNSIALTNGDFEYSVISEEEQTIKITKYLGEAKKLEIPSTINGYEVAMIGEYAFSFCHTLLSITIPNTVTKIDDGAFQHCESLKNVVIPNSVTTIDRLAFSNCRSLEYIEIPNSVTKLGDTMFADCCSLKDIKLSDKMSVISGFLFLRCFSMQTINIPRGVTDISSMAFYDCNSLTSVTIPDSVNLINASAFAECKLLENVFYLGSNHEWKNIDIKMDNDYLLNANIHYHYGEEHVFGEWSAIKSKGLEIRSCKYCDYTESREITSIIQPTTKIEKTTDFIVVGKGDKNDTNNMETTSHVDYADDEGNQIYIEIENESNLVLNEEITNEVSKEEVNENSSNDGKVDDLNKNRYLRYALVGLTLLLCGIVSVSLIYRKLNNK